MGAGDQAANVGLYFDFAAWTIVPCVSGDGFGFMVGAAALLSGFLFCRLFLCWGQMIWKFAKRMFGFFSLFYLFALFLALYALVIISHGTRSRKI